LIAPAIVFSVERALRPAQDFEILDVDHVEQRRLRPRQIHIVDVHAYAGFEPP